MSTEQAGGRKLIMVLGMHRSGTSALTRMLSLLGADPGKELLEAQEGVNERGFWEHRELVEINEALLSKLGTHWYDFRPLAAGWWEQKNLASLRTRASKFLRTAFASDDLAVIKDPRLCILLPFWEPLIRQAGWQPSAVIATRAPWEVAASLCRRDPLDESTANLLWLRYFHDAEILSRDLQRCVVDYQQMLSAWDVQAARIARQLDVKWPADRDEVDSQIDDAIDPSLRHQTTRFKSSDIQIASLASQVYHQLQDLTAHRDQLDALWTEIESLFTSCEVMGDTVAAGNARLIEINTRLQALGNDHQQALDTIRHRDEQLAALNAKVEALGRVHHEALKMVEVRDGQLAEVHEELKSLGAQHRHAQQVVHERDGQLQQLNQKMQQLGEEHAEALTVLAERDEQLQGLNQKLQQLGKEHAESLVVLAQRDDQLQQANRKLQQLGDEHSYALGIVQERDDQLAQRNAEYENLSAQYQKLRNQPLVKGMVKLLSLEDK